MYRHMLVPIDNSKAASAVLGEAASLHSRCTDCTLTLIHVQTPVHELYGGLDMALPVSGVEKRLEEEAQGVLEDASRWLDSRRIAHRKVLKRGDPAKEICRYAEQANADLIVIGKRDKGLLEKLLLRSVSKHVVRNAPTRVLVVK